MKKFFALFITVFLIGLIVGYLSIPTNYDTGMLYYSTGMYSKAKKFLIEYQHESDDNSLRVILPLSKIYFKDGQTDKAVSLLQNFLSKNPESLEAKVLLGKFYKGLQRPMDYTENLSTLASIHPSKKIYQNIIDEYYRAGDFDSMYKVLKKELHQNSSLFTEQDYYKLIYYYTAKGNYKAAEKVITFFLNEENNNINDVMMAELIVTVYLYSHNNIKAFDTSKVYIQNSKVSLSDKLQIVDVVSSQSPKTALDLLNILQEKYRNNPSVQQSTFQIELSLNKEINVYNKIIKLFDNGIISPKLWETSISVFLYSRDYNRLDKLLSKIDVGILPEEVITNIAVYFLFDNRKTEALKLKNRLGESYLDNDELTKKLLYGTIKDDKPESVISKVLNNEIEMSDNQIFLIATFLYKTGAKELSYKLIKTQPIKDIALKFDSDPMADLIISFGNVNNFMSSLKKLNKKYEYSVSKFAEAYLILAAATGKSLEFDRFILEIKGRSDVKTILKNAYFSSLEFKQNAISLIIAKKLYKLSDNAENKQYYIEALILNNKYVMALSLISDNYKNPNYEQNFINAYHGILQSKDNRNIERYKPELKQLFTQSKKNNSNKDLYVSLGYLLSDAGLKEMARDVFFKLSYNAPPDSSYVKELIYLWGKKPWPEGLQWLTMRAKKAHKMDQVKWLEYLYDTGNPKEIISIVEKK